MSKRDDRRGAHAGPNRVARFSLGRRRALRSLLVPVAGAFAPHAAFAAAGSIASARIWPAQEYTRLILETRAAVSHRLIGLKDPPRIVLDLDAIELTPELQQLSSRVAPGDPYIARIRFGKQPPDVLRVVLDLREEVTTELFALQPVGDFGHRVVLDLYPLTPVDPLMALLNEKPDAAPAQPVDRPADARPQPP